MKTNYSLSVGKQFCGQNCKELTNLLCSGALIVIKNHDAKIDSESILCFSKKTYFSK
jgi:hypothetical protein